LFALTYDDNLIFLSDDKVIVSGKSTERNKKKGKIQQMQHSSKKLQYL